jgi:hypothetical protein
MKRLVLICFVLFCFILKSKSQNLVPNYSFENHSDCSTGYIYNADDWGTTRNGGFYATYLHPCQTDPYLRTPGQYVDACFQSYQIPHSGVAYGSFAISIAASQEESSHPQVKLIDTLKAGKIYCVTYYISKLNNAKYSFDKLGALLTPTPFPNFIAPIITPSVPIAGQYTPQIVSTPSLALEDTLNWMEISGSFTALGNEAYLTLGDFFLHSQHYIKNSGGCNGIAEYYVDDVSVEVVEIAKAKNDTLIYQGDSVLVVANNSAAALFSWQPSAGLSCTNCPNPKASPSVTTTYTFTKTQCKSVTSDVITVSVSPTSLKEFGMTNVDLRILPNPANDLVTVTSRYDFEKIELLSITGQVLLKETVNSKTHQLQLQDFAEGIYFVKVSYADGRSLTKKVIKQ